MSPQFDSNENDTIVGTNRSEVFSGRKGGADQDILIGNGGKYFLNGGDANDRFLGEAGNDILTGGSGQDQFIFRQSDIGGNNDTITDFATDIDILRLQGFAFSDLDEV